jgi:hypothetical protein
MTITYTWLTSEGGSRSNNSHREAQSQDEFGGLDFTAPDGDSAHRGLDGFTICSRLEIVKSSSKSSETFGHRSRQGDHSNARLR